MKGWNKMIKEIVKDVLFLEQKSEPATKEDAYVVTDLIDTLRANLDHCVGMAANMIGIKKNIIAVNTGNGMLLMFNPRIVNKQDQYETEEGCLSLEGIRPCIRYREIEVEYQDMSFRKQKHKYTGWTAQIIQHEIDHCNGIII